MSAAAAVAKVGGSVGVTPAIMLAIRRVDASAPARGPNRPEQEGYGSRQGTLESFADAPGTWPCPPGQPV